jgi:hypothetical protein
MDGCEGSINDPTLPQPPPQVKQEKNKLVPTRPQIYYLLMGGNVLHIYVGQDFVSKFAKWNH